MVPSRVQEKNYERSRRDSWVSARYKACSQSVQMKIRKRTTQLLGSPIGEGGMSKWAAWRPRSAGILLQSV